MKALRPKLYFIIPETSKILREKPSLPSPGLLLLDWAPSIWRISLPEKIWQIFTWSFARFSRLYGFAHSVCNILSYLNITKLPKSIYRSNLCYFLAAIYYGIPAHNAIKYMCLTESTLQFLLRDSTYTFGYLVLDAIIFLGIRKARIEMFDKLFNNKKIPYMNGVVSNRHVQRIEFHSADISIISIWTMHTKICVLAYVP